MQEEASDLGARDFSGIRIPCPGVTRADGSEAGVPSMKTRSSSTSRRAADQDSPGTCLLRTAASVRPASVGATSNPFSERVLEADERRDLVPEPVVVEVEEEVHVDEKAFHHVELEAHGAAQEVVGLRGERDGRGGGPRGVEAGERGLVQTGSVEEVRADHVEDEGEPLAHPEVGAHDVSHLIRQVLRFSRRGVSGENARPVPEITGVEVGRECPRGSRKHDERTDARGADAQEVLLVTGRDPHVETEGHRTGRATLEPNRHVADAARAPERGEGAPIPDFVLDVAEEVDVAVDGGAEAPHGGGGDHREGGRDHRNREREGETGGQTVADERRELVHPGVDGIHGGDHVLAASPELGAIVGEDRRNVVDIEPFDGIEDEVLEGEAEGESAASDGLGALGEDRAEALARALEDAEVRVELVGEPRSGGGERHRGELARERDAELGELRLEGAVEVRRVRLPAGKDAEAVDDETLLPVNLGEYRRELIHGNRYVERILRLTRARGKEEKEDACQSSLTHESHPSR